MAGKGIVIQISGDGESARAALEMVREQLAETAEKAKEEGSQISEAMEMVTRSLERVGIYLGIREAIDLMKEMVAGSVELGMEIGHLAKETGISAENLSVLKYASDVTGVSFEALSKGSVKLSRSMLDAQEGNREAINSFARLGISQAEVTAKSHDLYGMLEVIADRFQKIPDGPNKAATAMGLFGRAGAALIPFLDQGAAGIEELRGQAESLGLVLDEAGIQKMEQLHAATVRLKGGIEGASLAITEGMTPALLQVGASLQSASSQANGFEEIGQSLGIGVKVLASAWDFLTVAVRQTVDALYGVSMTAVGTGRILGDALTGDSAAVKRDWQEMVNQVHASLQVAGEDGKNFKEEMDALWGDHPMPKAPPERKTVPTGDIHPGDMGAKQHAQSTDGAARAAAELADAQVQAQVAALKAGNQTLLAVLEEEHKAALISDQEFYTEKTLLQQDDIDAEVDALQKKAATLKALQDRQHGDKTLKDRDANGNSAQELTTARQIVAVNQQINDLLAKRQTLDGTFDIDAQVRGNQTRLATAKLAAQVEEETNTTITARLALLRLENQIELQKIAASAGMGSPEYAQAQALEKVKELKLQIGDVDRQIRASEEDNKRAVEELADAAAKDPRFKRAAEQQINQLNRQEADSLRDLVAQYDALAQQLGGPFLQTAKNLHAELDKLNTPSRKEDAQFTKTLTEGVESMADQMAEATTRGKDSFHQMAQSIEQDIVRLALKLAMQKWLTPLLSGLGGGGGGGMLDSGGADVSYGMDTLPGFASGGDPTGPSIVGEEGPELFFPKGPGTITPNSMLSQISEGGSKSPSVTMNITNASSQPVTARTTGTSYDSEMKQFIVHTVLEDHASGGPIAQSMAGLTGSN